MLLASTFTETTLPLIITGVCLSLSVVLIAIRRLRKPAASDPVEVDAVLDAVASP